DGPAFLSYIKECLGPTLKPGDTVVMDHCPIHKVSGVEEAIEACGARVEYLPKYSPDLNPIELSFSKFKAYLRKFAERTVPTLYQRVGAFVPTLSRAECRNYFRTRRLRVNLTGIRCRIQKLGRRRADGAKCGSTDNAPSQGGGIEFEK